MKQNTRTDKTTTLQDEVNTGGSTLAQKRCKHCQRDAEKRDGCGPIDPCLARCKGQVRQSDHAVSRSSTNAGQRSIYRKNHPTRVISTRTWLAAATMIET